MSPTQLQIVKWSFPAFALIIGLFWYKRRRVDRADPGGENKTDFSTEMVATDRNREAVTGKPTFYDSGIQFDEPPCSFSTPRQQATEEPNTCSPRKVSESLDIPTRKSQLPASRSLTPQDPRSWYRADISPDKAEIQLGSNPRISNFDMVARSRSSCSIEAGKEMNGKMLKIFENVTEEDERNASEYEKSMAEKEDHGKLEEHQSVPTEEQPAIAHAAVENIKTEAQKMSERDSANHSPISGLMEGSVTDEARSEGSTDSGKGGSITGHGKDQQCPMIHQFDIPQHLVGRLIGRHGTFLEQIRMKTGVCIMVKRHPVNRDAKLCTIEGTREEISEALNIIRHKFPEHKYPEITFAQMCVKNEGYSWFPQIAELQLIEGVTNDVILCNICKPNRLFMQLPTHPSYPSLRILDDNMTQWYNTIESPPVPEQLSKGVLLVVKWYHRWVRATVVQPDPEGVRHLVRLVDHGGYWYFSSAEMRKIRGEYISYPFQAIEVFIANVKPKDGSWNPQAYDVVAQICGANVGQAHIIGYTESSIYINLYLSVPKYGLVSLADELVARGYAEYTSLESVVSEEGVSVP